MSWLVRIFGRNRWEFAATVFVLLVDAAHRHWFDALNARLRDLLRQPSEFAAAVILGGYVCYLLSLYFIGRLEPTRRPAPVTFEFKEKDGRRTKTTTTWPKVLFFCPSIGFGIVVLMAASTVMGFGEEGSPVSDDWQQAAILGGVALVFVHIALAVIDLKPRYASGTAAYLAVLVPTVLVSEAMLNLSTAFWYRFLGPDAAGPVIENPSAAGSFAFALPLYLLFFAAPRFTFIARSFSWATLASSVGTALFALWGLVKVAPLF